MKEFSKDSDHSSELKTIKGATLENAILKPSSFSISVRDACTAGNVDGKVFCDYEQSAKIMSHLAQFRRSQNMCDVVLEVDGQSLAAHRVVLAAAIPYFEAMFSCGMVEEKMHRISLNDISFEALDALVNFVYTNEITISSDSVQNLLFAASILQELRQLDEFKEIAFPHLRDLIRRSDLKITCEEQVFETVMEWMEANPSERKQHLPELLSLVRLPQLNMHYLLENVRQNNMVKESRECTDLVSEAMFIMLLPLKGIPLPACTTINEEGGSTGGDPFRSVEAFDCRLNRWISICEMTQQRRHVGVVSAQGKLFAIGGHDGVQHLASAEVFDPKQSVGWCRIAPMHTCRRGIAAAALDGAIYAVGGLDDTTCFSTVERYDIESNTWSEVAQMNVRRGGVGVSALGKFLFAVGGNDGSSSLDSCERYDPVLDKWKLVSKMTNRRLKFTLTEVL
uniref:BTB domain-containing protein n=1 Tax=Angiostrongylus cantonensis TaxID=6313 RepID=A0A158PAY3_ANGCA